MMTADTPNTSRSPSPIPWRQDFIGGLVVIAVAAFAFWQGADLPIGTFGTMGPGMLPRGLAVLLGLLGALLMLTGVLEIGPPLERWPIRGPIFILGAIAVFGLTVRPYGLIVAGPLAIMVGACSSDEVRWGETFLFGIFMTAFCIGLFKYALGLPIPLAPWLLGY